MKRTRLAFYISLLLAAILGFGLGWWLRDRRPDTVEERAHRAVEQVRDSFRSLTR